MALINYGISLSVPYESESSIVQRIIQCNPCYKNLELQKNLTKVTTAHYRNARRRPYLHEERLLGNYHNYLYQQQKPTPKLTANHFDDPKEHNPNWRIRNCPQCAQSFFHTHLYDFSWLTSCPIHHEPLVTSCPECRQAWPYGLDVLKRNCSLCGLYKSYTEFTRLRNIFNDNKSIFNTINAAIEKNSHDSVAGFLYEGIGMTEWRPEMSMYHPYYPATRQISSQRSNKYLNSIEIEAPEFEIKSWTLKSISKAHNQKLSNKVWPINYMHDKHAWANIQGYIQPLPVNLIKARKEAIKHVYQGLSVIHPNDHLLCKRSVPSEFYLHNDCPYCIAFSIWFDFLIVPTENFIGINSSSLPFCYFRGINAFPKIPFPLTYVKTKNKNICQTSSIFQAYTYKLELMLMFQSIYKYICKFYEIACEPKEGQVTFEDMTDSIKNESLQLNEGLFFFIKNKRLHSCVPKKYLKHPLKFKPFQSIDKLNSLLSKNNRGSSKNAKSLKSGLNINQTRMLSYIFSLKQSKVHYQGFSENVEFQINSLTDGR